MESQLTFEEPDPRYPVKREISQVMEDPLGASEKRLALASSLEKPLPKTVKVEEPEPEPPIVLRKVEWTSPDDFPEYIDDILTHLRELERKRIPRHNFLLRQKEIDDKSRAVLVDWLVLLGQEFSISSETLHLSVNFVDRFLSLMLVPQNKLQLLGVTSFFVASKIEDVEPPSLSSLTEMCDGACSMEEIRFMEGHLLKAFNFHTSFASPLAFCSKFFKVANANLKTRYLTEYLCELALLDYNFTRYLPSEIAASALVLSLYTLDLPHWDFTLQHYLGYTLDCLLSSCIPSLSCLFKQAPNCQFRATFEKYSIPELEGVSSIEPKLSLPTVIA